MARSKDEFSPREVIGAEVGVRSYMRECASLSYVDRIAVANAAIHSLRLIDVHYKYGWYEGSYKAAHGIAAEEPAPNKLQVARWLASNAIKNIDDVMHADLPDGVPDVTLGVCDRIRGFVEKRLIPIVERSNEDGVLVETLLRIEQSITSEIGKSYVEEALQVEDSLGAGMAHFIACTRTFKESEFEGSDVIRDRAILEAVNLFKTKLAQRYAAREEAEKEAAAGVAGEDRRGQANGFGPGAEAKGRRSLPPIRRSGGDDRGKERAAAAADDMLRHGRELPPLQHSGAATLEGKEIIRRGDAPTEVSVEDAAAGAGGALPPVRHFAGIYPSRAQIRQGRPPLHARSAGGLPPVRGACAPKMHGGEAATAPATKEDRALMAKADVALRLADARASRVLERGHGRSTAVRAGGF